MAVETLDHYLQLLKLSRSASEQEIRNAITRELRLWSRRVNAPTLETRQEAERRIQTLEAAEQALLGPDGARLRARLIADSTSEAPIEVPIVADVVARAIECIASSRGTKAQERDGTVLARRATVFYRGVDYVLEELVHKSYEAALDRKRCSARQEGFTLFDHVAEGSAGRVQTRTATYVSGRWVTDLVGFAAECVSSSAGSRS